MHASLSGSWPACNCTGSCATGVTTQRRRSESPCVPVRSGGPVVGGARHHGMLQYPEAVFNPPHSKSMASIARGRRHGRAATPSSIPRRRADPSCAGSAFRHPPPVPHSRSESLPSALPAPAGAYAHRPCFLETTHILWEVPLPKDPGHRLVSGRIAKIPFCRWHARSGVGHRTDLRWCLHVGGYGILVEFLRAGHEAVEYRNDEERQRGCAYQSTHDGDSQRCTQFGSLPEPQR